MRVVNWAATVAGLSLWASAASAEVLMLPPHGADNTLDFYIQISKPGDFSVRFTYDEAAFDPLSVNYFLQGSVFAYFPCAPGPLCLYSESDLDLAEGSIDPQVAGSAPKLFGSSISQLNWSPNDDGFTMNFYADNHCYMDPSGATCHQIEELNFVSFYGKAASDQPLRFEVTYGPAAPHAVPEPTTWAMMIAGFGLVGSTLRRRRTIAA